MNFIFVHQDQPWHLAEEMLIPPAQNRTPSPFIIIANKFLSGPVILNIGGKK